MRLLELSNPARGWSGDHPAPLRIHPRLAVLRAGAAERAAIVEQLSAVMSGQSSVSRGLVEVHGVLFDFSAETAVLLALDGAVQPILRPGDLPGTDGSETTRQRRHLERQHDEARRQVAHLREVAAAAVTEREALERRLRAVDDELGRRRAVVGEATERTEQLRREHREAVSARDAADHRRHSLRAELAQLEARRAAADTAVADAERRLEAAVADRERRSRALADADARLASLQAGAPPDTSAATAAVESARAALSAAHLDLRAAEARLETLQTEVNLSATGTGDRARALQRRRAELVSELSALDLSDPREVEASLAAVQATGGPDPRASALAARLAEVGERRRSLSQRPPAGPGPELEAAYARLAQARQDHAALTASTRSAVLDQAARAAIERAHEDVLEAEDKASRRFAGSSAKARLSELRDTERELLSRFGLSSFSDYLLAASTARVDPATQLRVSELERQVAEAEAQVAALANQPSAPVVDPELDQLDAIESGLRAEALGLLGFDPGPDLIGALHAHAPAGGATTQLEAALARIGVAADTANVATAARAWLADRAVAGRRAEELQRAVAALDAEAAEVAEVAATSDGGASIAAALAAAHDDVARCSAARTEASNALVEARRQAEELLAGAPSVEQHHATMAALLSEREVTLRAVQDGEAMVGAAERDLEQQRTAVLDTMAQRESLQRQVQGLDTEVAALQERCERLAAELDRLDLALTSVSAPSTGIDAPDGALLAAQSAESAATLRLAQAQQRADELWAFTERARAAEAQEHPSSSVNFDDLEFYVLGRIAAQRSVGLVGSVPLVVDDAFAGLPAEDIVRLLDRLDRMSASVQIVYLTEDPVVLRWAMARPGDRVSMVEVPQALDGVR